MITINNKELSVFGISKYIKFSIETSNYTNQGSYWSEGSLKSIKGNKNETYRKLSTKFIFKGENRELIFKNISKFIEECKECIFKMDNLFYEVEINGNSEPDVVNPNMCFLDIDFNLLDIYEAEKSITTTANATINISSPKPCYANLELTASTNVISYTVKISDTEIVVKNIKGGETVYIGSGKVLAGGKSKMNDVDIWEFPRLKTGANTISVSRADVSLKIKYNERW